LDKRDSGELLFHQHGCVNSNRREHNQTAGGNAVDVGDCDTSDCSKLGGEDRQAD
jgi:hypothetical protein